MKNRRVRALWIGTAVLAGLVGAALVFATKTSRVMLFQHGTPEVPGNRAFAIMNPFRYRRPEEVAVELMADLRTSRCDQILRHLHSEDTRICTVLRQDTNPKLIWREDEDFKRNLVYDLPRSKSRLWITSSREEGGFVVSSVSLVR